MLTSDPARARELYIAARDKDPAPVRMTTAHGRVFEDVMTAHGVPWVDADACARRAAGSEIVGDAAIVDFMHPRENVHAEIAVELAKKFGAMGLTGLDASDAAAEARFREACRAWRAGQLGEVELGDARGLHWFVMMYLVFGNPRAARERALTCAPEKRALDVTLMLDLAARWCGDASGAARELAAARARRPEWKAAIDAWCEATGAER
jgi:hypothetical protein